MPLHTVTAVNFCFSLFLTCVSHHYVIPYQIKLVYTYLCAQLLQLVRFFETQGLEPARLLCPWDSPGKNTGLGGLPYTPPGDLPNPGSKPASLVAPALAGRFFITGTM